MMKHAYRAAFATGLLLLEPTAGAAGSGLGTVHVRGSTTFLSAAQRVGESYMEDQPGTTVAISGGGTVRGYKSIMDGTADIALVSGPAPLDLHREILRRGIKLVSKTVAYNAIVAVVHPSNPIDNLSAVQLKGIFTGRINNWKSVGGSNAPITVLIGPPTGGITEAWKDAVIGDEGTYTPKAAVMSAAARAKRISAEPLAIGFLVLNEINRNVKPLKFNQVAASTDTVHDGKYPLRTALTLVTSDKPSAAATAFINYFTDHQKQLEFAGIITSESTDALEMGNE